MTAVSVSTRSDQSTFERAGVDPGEELDDDQLAVLRAEADAHEDEDRQRRGDQQRRAGDDLRRPVADDAAEQAGDGGREQRQQDDELDGKIHGASRP